MRIHHPVHSYNLGRFSYNMYHALDLTAKLVVKEEDPLNEKHLYLFYVVPNYDSHGAGDGHSGAKKISVLDSILFGLDNERKSILGV